MAVASGRPDVAPEYAEWTAPLYRRRGVSMDDVIALSEGLRKAFPRVLAPDEMPAADPAIDEAIKAYRWHRRIAGDARHKQPASPVPVQGRLSG